jgi:hypothetical protein
MILPSIHPLPDEVVGGGMGHRHRRGGYGHKR